MNQTTQGGQAIRGNTIARHAIDAYTAALFRDYVGQRFIFGIPESAVPVCGAELEMVLVEVREDERFSKSAASRASRTGKPFRNPFSILFRADRESLLSSGLLRLRHPDFEEFALFLSRVQMLSEDIDGDVAAPHFEAVFA